MNLNNKTLQIFSLVSIPLILASIYLIKSITLALPLLFAGVILQVQLYRNYKKENRGKEFLKAKLGPMILAVALILYFVVKYSISS